MLIVGMRDNILPIVMPNSSYSAGGERRERHERCWRAFRAAIRAWLDIGTGFASLGAAMPAYVQTSEPRSAKCQPFSDPVDPLRVRRSVDGYRYSTGGLNDLQSLRLFVEKATLLLAIGYFLLVSYV